jgi:hypothetical protein
VSTQDVAVDDVDFAVAAYREDGRWAVSALAPQSALDIDTLVTRLRQFPGEGVVGQDVRIMISDAAALLDWSLAEEAADLIELEWDEDDIEDFEAAGDVTLCENFGLDGAELVMICEDEEMYPDEQIRAIAKRLGFANELATAIRGR